jgi:NitT/TauT family transport system substrate-binding protein
MLAGKIDIGSMGDYPLLINGSTLGTSSDRGSSLVATTGYNLHGALNGVVVSKTSDLTSVKDLRGKRISASIGSAGHGMLVQALDKAGIDPVKQVHIENQQPSVGASALQSGTVDAISQFVAWPAYLSWRDDARLVYDGGALGVPTFHGVVVRNQFAHGDQDVLEAFLKAQVDATDYLHQHPLEAAESVAQATGLPAEVVYLYNGRNGLSTFDPTLKQPLLSAFSRDVPFLKSIGVIKKPLDPGAFVDDKYIRQAVGSSYDTEAAATTNKAAITGEDQVCRRKVDDPATAGEVWVEGEQDTRPVADAGCLLRNVDAVEQQGKKIRAAYVPDALTGTRWFADRSVWLEYGGTLLPFATQDNADAWRSDHPGGKQLTWDQALQAVKKA